MEIGIIGSGKSGIAAAKLAQRQGYSLFLSEAKTAAQLPSATHSFLETIEHEKGGHTARLLEAKTIIVSPGVPPSTPILVEAANKGIPIISELEFAWRHTTGSVIALTGTNGKTTTTALTEFILQQAGLPAMAVGNIGVPFSDKVDTAPKGTIFVVEASSYQLDRITSFAPQVAAILNITPDHLSYHGDFETYKNAKKNIFYFQNQKNIVILNSDDENTSVAASEARSQVHHFGSRPTQQGMVVRSNYIHICSLGREEQFMNIQEIRMPGFHNVYNSMAAAIAARAVEVSNEDIRNSLRAFRGVEHRLEFVRSIDTVDIYNDSKATNVNATWYALGSFQRPIVWIAGGRGDNNDYKTLLAPVQKQVECIVAIGEEKDAIAGAFSTATKCRRVETLEEAIKTALAEATENSVILFSPACKSFDMFDSFEHRGDEFKKLVRSL